jgi:hypothetical protein
MAFVSVSQRGLAENPRFIWERWDNGVYRVIGELEILGTPSYQLEGTFWDSWLVQKCFAKGRGKARDENYTRTLAIACEDTAFRQHLFSHTAVCFPKIWFRPILDMEILPGLNNIEKLYAQYLPETYQGFGHI